MIGSYGVFTLKLNWWQWQLQPELGAHSAGAGSRGGSGAGHQTAARQRRTRCGTSRCRENISRTALCNQQAPRQSADPGS